MTPTGATRVAAVIGAPARHSLSPTIHNAAFAACELDWVYVAFDVAAGRAAEAAEAVRTLGMAGLSVTMPHKSDMATAVDHLDGVARRLGAVNCVVPMDGSLHGHNTDGEGFLRGLTDDTGAGVRDARVLVLGAGGAARAVVLASAAAGASEVAVHNRTPARATAVAGLAGERGGVADPASIGQYDVVVNATPVGMGDDRSLPCPVDRLGRHARVVDLVYDPVDTEWLRQCRSRGIEAHNGLSMLVHQAAVAFELWTGLDAPVEVMRTAVEAAIGPG